MTDFIRSAHRVGPWGVTFAGALERKATLTNVSTTFACPQTTDRHDLTLKRLFLQDG